MTRCGQGWELSCSHGRPYYTREPKHQLLVDENGMPTYSITPNKEYSEAYKELFGKKPSPSVPEYYVDILKVKLLCNTGDCLVTLDDSKADLVKGKTHYFMVSHKKSKERYQDPGRKFPFVATLNEAFSFTPTISINPNSKDPLYAPQTMVLNVDGDKVNIKVYPGNYYSLIISLPPARVKGLKRGIDAKEKLKGGKDEKGVTITDNVAEEGGKKDPTSKKAPQGNSDKSYSVRDLAQIKSRLGKFFETKATEKTDHRLEFKSLMYKDEEEQYVVYNDSVLTNLLNAAPVTLLHNGKPVTLSALESIAVTIGLLGYIAKAIQALTKSTFKVGWYFEISTEFVKGSGVLDWGFAELESGYMVECYRAFGTNYTLVDASFEIGFGLKADKAEVVAYFKLAGKLDLNCAIKNPPVSNVLNTGNVEIGVTFTATAGVRGKCGEVLSLDGGAEVSLTAKGSINLNYKGADDSLVHVTAQLSPIELKFDFKAGDYRIVSCKKEIGDPKELADVKFPARESDLSKKDQDLGEKGFLDKLTYYVKLCRKNDLDVHMEVTYSYTNMFNVTYDRNCDDNDVAKTIVEAMKNILRGEYELMDFTERAAEGLVREVADLIGSCRFGDESKRKVFVSMDKFRDILALSTSKTNAMMYPTGNVRERREKLFGILVNYRSPCKVFKRKLEQDEKSKQKS